VLRISVLALSMYPIFSAHKIIERGKTDILNIQYIERGKPISSTHKYIERGKTDILNTQISMYVCDEDIGFTSFYVFVR
jgi:hypothetical protein